MTDKKSIDEWLEDYKKTIEYALEYDRWFKDFEGTDRFYRVLTEQNGDTMKIHMEQMGIFNAELRLKREVEEYYQQLEKAVGYEEFYPSLKIDASQRDNYLRQYRAWMTKIKDTCPNREFYFGKSYGIKERMAHERYFFKHEWDPKKTVNEEEMKSRFGQDWYKDYEYRYDAI